MKLSEVKSALNMIHQIQFQLPDKSMVPAHFHVTEVGLIKKKFIDCGGTVREESVINFQLWEASDFDHRLAPEKLLKIIKLSEDTLSLEDFEVEVEYQGRTIEKYSLEFKNMIFALTSKNTDCLAPDKCGVESTGKSRLQVSSCEPGSGCC